MNETTVSFEVATIDYDIILYKDVLNELFEAIRMFNNNHAKELCASKKIINDKDAHGWSPLTVAVYYSNVEMIKYLISRGADFFVLNNNGTNLLMYAKDAYLRKKDNCSFRIIKNMGVDEYQKDYNGNDLFYYMEKDGISLNELLT